MADSTLRLKIATALDNAGLKATKEQLDGLEKQLAKVNNSSGGNGGIGKLPSKLQKLPGLIGDITGGLGKVGSILGTLYTVYKTFEKSLDGGNKIFEKFSDGAGYSIESVKNGFLSLWGDIKNGFQKIFTGTNAKEAAEKAAEIAKQNQEAAIKAAEQATAKKLDLMKKEQAEHEKVISSIQKETNAYIRQAQSLGGLKGSLGNAKALQLERTKIEEQRAYDLMGRSDIADQIGLAYDVEIQRIKNESATEQNAIEERQAEKDWTTATQVAELQQKKTDELQNKMTKIQEQMTELKRQKLNGVNLKTYAELKKQFDTVSKDYEKSLESENGFVDTANEKLAKLQMVKQNGANLRLSNQQALEQAMINYDNFETANGNVGNFSFDEKYVESLNKIAGEWRYMEETAANTQALAEKLDELLQAR